MDAVASQSRLELLIRAWPRRIHSRVCARRAVCTVTSGTRRRASNEAAVIAPVEADPRTNFPRLVLHVTGEVEFFVVIDPERSRCRGNRARPADLGSEKGGSHAGQHHEP